MKVLCSGCEAAEARVLCCADEAALCERCDRDVHAANRLAGKHQRLPLLAPAGSAASAQAPPKCDICQECHAYFFCLEDRALLCRSCDVAVHTANELVSAHRRFLVTGVQVSLDEQDDCSSDPIPQPEPSPAPPAKSDQAPLYGDGNFSWSAAAATPHAAGVCDRLPSWSALNEQFGSPAQRREEATSRISPQKRSPRAPAFSGQGGMMDWPLGEFFGGFSNFNGGFGFGESGTSKADSGKQGGSTGGSPYYVSSSDDQNADELFGQVPEMHSLAPELPSPPTASGLHWQRRPGSYGYGDSDSSAFVPDISSPDNSLRHCFPADKLATAKRRRKC